MPMRALQTLSMKNPSFVERHILNIPVETPVIEPKTLVTELLLLRLNFIYLRIVHPPCEPLATGILGKSGNAMAIREARESLHK